MTDNELLRHLESLRSIMVSVATGGQRIDEVNQNYQQAYSAVDQELGCRRIPNPIPYADLWEWYGRWRSGDLPSYQSRRTFLAEIFTPLLGQIQASTTGRIGEPPPLTGWPRVDRTVGEIRIMLAAAQTEEQFQSIGLLCREVLISLAQAVYISGRHPPIDEITPSDTDARRMLEAYIVVELASGPNEKARAHARAALKLALALQHRRTADFRQGAMCMEATATVINVIAIVSGRRDP